MREQYKGRRYSVVRVDTRSRISMGRWVAWCQTLAEARRVADNQKQVDGSEIWIERLVDTRTGKHLGRPVRIERRS